MIARFAFSIFLSAFLLFQIQPIIARYILPWFGGGAAVWTTCLLFFQVMLLAGYGYAHLVATFLRPRAQAVVHIGLLLLSLFALPITPAEESRPAGDDGPAMRILFLLLTTVGFPFLMVSTSGPILQHWFSRGNRDRSPYRLYALSNAGSLLGLLTYPFLFEPAFRLGTQTWMWSAGYLVYVISCCWICISVFRGERGQAAGERAVMNEGGSGGEARFPAGDRVLWILLPACGSMLLLATTNQLCQNVAVVPFLWVLPLGVYLVSFIVCFDHDRWYRRGLWVRFAVAAVAVYVFLLYDSESSGEILILYQIPIYTAALFICCMFCHGELVRLRPAASRLTSFYLCVALGGALGGVFVGVLSPKIFGGFWELHVTLVLMGILFGVALFRSRAGSMKEVTGERRFAAWAFGVTALAAFLWNIVAMQREDLIAMERDFFGVLAVHEVNPRKESHGFSLYHGNITHGMQLNDPDRRRVPTTYYTKNSGAGLAMRLHPKRRAGELSGGAGGGLRVGLVGLGVGTLAAYSEKGDVFRFYELDASVERFAREFFSYIDDAPGKIEVVIGDGRVVLETELRNQGSQGFDILVVDAFSGDAVPVHLLTREAFALYWDHLREDGILAVNITNKHLDLRGVLQAMAREHGKEPVLIQVFEDEEDDSIQEYSSDWFLTTSNLEFLSEEEIVSRKSKGDPSSDAEVLWADDYSNLLSVLRLERAPRVRAAE